MRICFLADGGHTNCRNWIEYLANELHNEIYLISLEEIGDEIPGVKTYTIKTSKFLGKVKYIVSINQVRRLVEKINPDILVGYRVSSYGFLAACTGFHPLVLVAQGYNIDNPENSKLKDVFIRYAISRADMYQAWGKHMGECFEKLGADPGKIRVFPRGVNTERFRLFECWDGPLTAVMTRGLKPGYDLEFPIKAVADLKKKGIDIKLKIVGNGPFRSTLESLTRQLDLNGWVEFIGHIDTSDLPNVLASAHIYISPVPTDGVSSSLLEAMACGLIPIVTDNVANRLWINNGENGLLTAPGDYVSISEAIGRVVKKDIMPVEKIRKFNRRFVEEKGDWKINIKLINEEFMKLCKK